MDKQKLIEKIYSEAIHIDSKIIPNSKNSGTVKVVEYSKIEELLGVKYSLDNIIR